MNSLQRVVLTLYCFLVLYCCLWIPWHHSLPVEHYGHGFIRTGYGWLWRGPHSGDPFADLRSHPDLTIVVLRLIAVTAVCLGAYVIVAIQKKGS